MKKIILILIAALALVSANALAGDYDISADSMQRSGTLGTGYVEEGVIVQVNIVTVEGSSTANTVGTGLGAAVGGGLGSTLGKGKGKYLTGLIGAAAGGFGGNMATDALSSSKAQELIIKKANGQITVITQADSNLAAGQNVFLLQSGGKTRVVAKQ